MLALVRTARMSIDVSCRYDRAHAATGAPLVSFLVACHEMDRDDGIGGRVGPGRRPCRGAQG